MYLFHTQLLLTEMIGNVVVTGSHQMEKKPSVTPLAYGLAAQTKIFARTHRTFAVVKTVWITV